MRTFYITLAVVILWVTWQLNKPIPKQAQVAREFTDAEIEYLEKSFDYAMDTLKEGQHSDWSTAGVNGRISVGNAYQSKQRASCRNYVEIARTYNAMKTESGIACKREGKEGWCRLHVGDAESCALEIVESPIIKRARFAILQGNQVIDSIMGTRVNTDSSKLIPKIPNVDMPDIGQMPEIEQPDINLRPPLPWDKP